MAMIYEIAGLRILLKNKYPYTDKFCRAYLSANQTAPVDITASVTDAEMQEEREASPNFSEGYIENICLYRSLCCQIPLFDRMLMHCSVLEFNGEAYAFLGRSGTGKSTHTKLWLQNVSDARIINGDKPILEYRQGEFIAHGTPWMGKEQWGTRSQAPLKGLCFLEQAKVNAIKRLTPAQASAKLFMQILIPQEEENASKTLELADKMVTEIPAYLLQCDISQEAVKTSFEAMTGRGFEKYKRSIVQ